MTIILNITRGVSKGEGIENSNQLINNNNEKKIVCR